MTMTSIMTMTTLTMTMRIKVNDDDDDADNDVDDDDRDDDNVINDDDDRDDDDVDHDDDNVDDDDDNDNDNDDDGHNDADDDDHDDDVINEDDDRDDDDYVDHDDDDDAGCGAEGASVGHPRRDGHPPRDTDNIRRPSLPAVDTSRPDNATPLMRPLVSTSAAASGGVRSTTSNRLSKSRSETRVGDAATNIRRTTATDHASECRLTLSKSTADWTALYELP